MSSPIDRYNMAVETSAYLDQNPVSGHCIDDRATHELAGNANYENSRVKAQLAYSRSKEFWRI